VALIAGLEILDSPPADVPVLHHDRRYVRGVFLGGWRLGRSEVEDWTLGDPGVVGLVLNPPSALRGTSPLLVGGMQQGEVRWVAPFSPERVVLGDTGDFPGTDEVLRTVFSDFWDEVLYGLEGVIAEPVSQPIVDPQTRFGDMGVEIGAAGIAVHPMIRLLELDSGPRLWAALSSRRITRNRYAGVYSAEDIIDTNTGEPLTSKKGLVELKAGQAELAHFAVLSGSGWTSTETHIAARAVGSIADTFVNVWARDLRGDTVWGRQLWACDPNVALTRRCSGCRHDTTRPHISS